MEPIVSGIDKILWFIYRVFFVLIPAFLFTIVSIWIFYEHGEPYKQWLTQVWLTILARNSFLAILVGLGLCMCLNFVMDAIGECYLAFDDAIVANLENYSIFTKFKPYLHENWQKRFALPQPLTARELAFLARMEILQTNVPLNSYYWLIFCNYKIAIHLALYTLLGFLVYSPWQLGMSNLSIWQVSICQTITFVGWIWLTERVISAKQTTGHKLQKFLHRYAAIEIGIVGLCLLIGIALIEQHIFLGANFIVLPIFFLLVQFGYGQREYSRKIPLIGYISEKLLEPTNASPSPSPPIVP